MAKILAPNKSYTGISAGVAFSNGVGETEDKRLIEWFHSHGYTVEQGKKDETSKDEKSKGKGKKEEKKND